MIIDFLRDGADDCPLIRLREGTKLDIYNFGVVIQTVIDDNEIEIFSILGFHNGEEIQSLVFKLDPEGKGIIEKDTECFECGYSIEHYKDMLEKIEVYYKNRTGWFWLEENSPSDISLLLSTYGQW